MQRFYVDTVWNDEYRDLELKLNIQIIAEKEWQKILDS